MKAKGRRPRLRFVYAALLLLIFGLLESSPTADTFGGRAFAAFVNAPSLNAASLYFVDSGQLSPGGGWEAADLLGAELPNILKAEVLKAATTGQSGSVASSASLANITVLAGNAAQLTASFVLAEAWATTTGATGSVQVYDVTFGGVPVGVTGLPNQRIDIPGLLGPLATLIINEQTVTGSGSSQAITINALHVKLATGEEVILGSATSLVNAAGQLNLADRRRRSDPPGNAVAERKFASARKAALGDDDCAPGANPVTKVMNLLQTLGLRPAVLLAHDCFDFVTYGGFFFGSSDGSGRVNFGGNAGFKNGPPPPPLMVHVNVVDHNTGRHIKIQNPLSPDSYRPGTFFGDPCECRSFNGTGTQTLDGVESPVTAYVEVCDHGEPGNAPKGTDAFVIAFDGYFAMGDPIIGGNIQLHKKCPFENCP